MPKSVVYTGYADKFRRYCQLTAEAKSPTYPPLRTGISQCHPVDLAENQ